MTNITIYFTDLTVSGILSEMDRKDWQLDLSVIFNKSNRDAFVSHIVPGAIERYFTLGKPHFFDATWQAKNIAQIIFNPPIMTDVLILYIYGFAEEMVSMEGWYKVKIMGYETAYSYWLYPNNDLYPRNDLYCG